MIKRILTTIFVSVFVTFLWGQNSKPPLKLVQFVLTPDHADWNYQLKEKAYVDISVLQYGVPLKNVKVEYAFGKEMVGLDSKGELLLENGTAKLNIGTLKEPGFIQLKVSTKVDGYSYKDEVKVAFEPEKIMPTVKVPANFDTFWTDALKKNASLPMDAKIEYKPEYSTGTTDVYLVSLQNFKKGKRIFGYMCKPKKEGKYPVLFIPPGAGIKKMKPSTYYAEQGFISLSIEIHGISPELSEDDYANIKNAFNDYWFDNLDDKDNYYYKSVYVGCVRCIDFLTSLPEFDGKNVLVTGGSQGGALTIVTAGLDNRVTGIAAFYPALCDLSGYLNGRAGGWPHTFSEKYAKINRTPEKIETATYYDVVNFARKINVPGFYSTGYNDHTCPPTSVFSAFNVIQAPKMIVITPISGHWRFTETNDKAVEWLKEHCK